MRIRSIKPEFWTDEKTGALPAVPALFFAGLWNWSDDEGRFRWDPLLIRAALDPYDVKFGGPKGVARLLEQLRGLGIIEQYEAEGRRLGFIPSAPEHFKVNRPTPSKLPAPPARLSAPSVSRSCAVPAGSLPEREGSGEGEDQFQEREGDRATGEPAAQDPPPPAIEEVLAAARRDYEDLRQDPWDASEKARARDAAAAAACLESAGGSVEEVGIRWRTALVHKGWPRINTLRELEQHWAHFGNGPERARQRLRQMQAGGAS